jgi:LuxR family maltose regulon positive regulatory protein
MDANSDPGLILKITPPKLRKSLLVRERLRLLGASQDDVAVIVVEASAGYGKTSLLAQWRLDWLQDGAVVAWLNIDAGDSPITLVCGIALGLRRSMGRANFGVDAIEAVRRGAPPAAAMTSLLAEITEASHPMAIVFDNCERIYDAEAVDVLDYLLHNLPPNLRVAIGTRPPVRAETLDLLGHGILRKVTAADLSFDLSEAIHLLSSRLGGRVNADLCARLQDITRGWPLGLQLAAAALERAADPGHAIDEFAKSHDDATQHLFESLVASLPAGLGDFLTRCALLDSLHPSLCEAVTGDEDAALSLQRLVIETPLLSATEEGNWLRLHPLAREFLRSRAAERLSLDDQRQVHVHAWHWLAAHGFPERAAQHALAGGFRSEALQLISASLRDEFDLGHHGKVIEWLARIPQPTIESSLELRLVAVWMQALSCHLGDALQLAGPIIEDPGVPETARAEAMVAIASAYILLDRDDEARDYVARCESATDLRTTQVSRNLQAYFACNAGQTELGRRLLNSGADTPSYPVIQIWRTYMIAWSYLWEGRPVLAEQVARLYHARWEPQVGRRGPWAALLGGVLAAACWQQDLRSDAKSQLADRLDVIEQWTGYRGLMYAYLTLSQIAASEGDEANAFAYLEALAAIGEARGTVRLVATSLAERVRLHAARQRPAQATALWEELNALVDRSRMSGLLAPQVRLDLELAGAFTAMATNDPTAAETHLSHARLLAADLNRGYEAVQVLGLEALLAARSGRSPDALLTEALSRAESGGLVRALVETLPDVLDLVRRRAKESSNGAVTSAFIDRVLAASQTAAASEQRSVPAAASALLTPKENQVLHLLAGGLPNKRIAVELGLSNDTVKWHVKKLLAKLNAGSREHAVHRARMLGLLR